MSENKSPETLADLLQTIERSQELRQLARECGLTVRELRRRLARWRRELKPPATAPAVRQAGTAPPVRPAETDRIELDDLPAAAALDENPMPTTGSSVMEVYTDGASRGNPGPAAVGIVFGQQNGPLLCVHREVIGRATNNQAEYRAVLAALSHCDRWSVARVHLFLDSELVARQLLGLYRVKSQDLQPLYQQALQLIRRRREFQVRHLSRENNIHADRLANQALDAAEREQRRRS